LVLEDLKARGSRKDGPSSKGKPADRPKPSAKPRRKARLQPEMENRNSGKLPASNGELCRLNTFCRFDNRITDDGGYIGKAGGRWPWSPRFWQDTRVPQFLSSFF
jgi:hypothetical protein